MLTHYRGYYLNVENIQCLWPETGSSGNPLTYIQFPSNYIIIRDVDIHTVAREIKEIIEGVYRDK